MFIVVIFIFAGIALGRLLRGRRTAWLSRLLTVLIWLLLFLLGLEVGSNRQLIASLPTLGAEAAVIAPVIAGGDLCGCVALLQGEAPPGESEARLVQAAALFFSRQMEG